MHTSTHIHAAHAFCIMLVSSFINLHAVCTTSRTSHFTFLLGCLPSWLPLTALLSLTVYKARPQAIKLQVSSAHVGHAGHRGIPLHTLYARQLAVSWPIIIHDFVGIRLWGELLIILLYTAMQEC